MSQTKRNRVRAEVSDTEPNFRVFKREREEVPSVDEVWDEDTEVEFNPDEAEPDEVIQGYEALTEFLDEADDFEYLWAEENVEVAPVIQICSRCDATVKTNSQELLSEKRSTHHISTGH